MMFDRRLLQNFDWVLLFLLIGIAMISILNLYSATHAVENPYISDVFVKQIYWFLIGFAVFFLATTFNYFSLERFAYPIYFTCVGLLLLVLVIGEVTSGSQRWLDIGFFTFQPSEPAKIAVILVLAKFFSRKPEMGGYRLKQLWKPFLFIALPAGLILKEPDLGTALLLILISMSIVLIMGVRWKSLLITIFGGISLTPFIWHFLEGYQKMRILSFLRPDVDPLGSGYHINQSKIAIGSGLLWGKGFLKGTQTQLHFLPEQHTDFAFSVLAEEWGFVGSVFLLLLYLLLILWGLNIARISKDKFGAILAIGVVAMIFWQVVINVGMVTGLLPVVGLPLVLFSYGGSSLILTMAAAGLLMNISMRRFMFQ